MKFYYKQQYCKYLIFSTVFFFLLVFSSCAGGARIGNLGRASDPVPFMENARAGVLPSGMRYYILENSRPEGRAFLTLAVDAGSVLETEEERGLAHFVEHMAFIGTTRFPRMDLINYLRSLGMRFGPEINAHTSFDETVYRIEVPVEIGPDGIRIVPDMALAVMDDWSREITFNPEDVDNERLVIIEEYRTRLGARERISREVYPVLFRDSIYAERLPIGLPEVIENATAEQLRDFYERWYKPENMAIIIVGDFDAAHLEATLAGHFPDRRRESEEFYRPRHNLREPEKGSLQALVITDDELTQSRVELYWKRQAQAPRRDLAYYRQGIIDYLAHTMLSLRFDEEAAKLEAPFIEADTGLVSYGQSSRFYILYAYAKNGMTRPTLQALLMQKESLSRYGFTQDEFDIAKIALFAYLEQLVSEKDHEHSQQHVYYFTRHFLNGQTIPDIEWEQHAITNLLPGISLREINRTVRNYFSEDDLTIIITAPDSEIDSLPSQDDIRAMVSSASRARIARPSRARAQGELLPIVPAPGIIVSETTDNDTGALRLMLGNGAEVILKETQNRNNEIILYAQARGGIMDVPDEMAVSAALASEILNVSGLGSFSRTELTRVLIDRQVSMSFWTQNHLRGFQGSAVTNDIQVLFEMLYLFFTQPRYDQEAVQVLLDQTKSMLAGIENSPISFFSREITRTTHGNPRFYPMELSDLDSFDSEAAMAFIHNSLNPADYTFVFTGNLDPLRMRSLIETYLASITPSQAAHPIVAFNQWTDVDPMRPSGIDREIRRGREEQSTFYMSWFRPLAFSDENSETASVLNEYLEIVLNDEIREVLGGVYSISSWVSLSPVPRGELLSGIFFFSDPARTNELGAAAVEEVRKIARGEIDNSVFEKAIEALIQDHEQSVQSNLYIARSYANSAVIYNSPLSRLDRRPNLQRAVSHGDIQRMAAELLAGSQVRMILLQEH